MRDRTPRHSADRPAHVLVMDDTPAILDRLLELLEGDGYRVTIRQEMLELSEIRAVQPDAIVQDLLFSGEQGRSGSFLTTARLDAELALTPIILCTAATWIVNDAIMAEQLCQLRVRVVLKPFDIDDLLVVLADSLMANHIGRT